MSSRKENMGRRIDSSRRVSESGEELCPVCHDVMKIFAYGVCNHPICYKCSTRMRVLCDQMYCAICRRDLPKVAFCKSGSPPFEKLILNKFNFQHKYKINFEDDVIRNAFFEVQEHRCNICKSIDNFKTFAQLKDHMRKVHALFSCDICVRHLTIFSKDRKFYDRKGLGEHRRQGDADDSSYKAHPLCKFCDERYLDNDELLKHLRKDHYYCHFCEADGITNEYYDTYAFLRDHFRDSHFLCEEDECYNTEFTNAFRDEIDLKAHKAAVHHKNLKKAMAKAARTLEIDFNVSSRSGARNNPDSDSERRGARGGRGGRQDRQRQREDDEIQRAITVSLNQATNTSVSVVDPSLLVPVNSLSGSNEDVRSRADKQNVGRDQQIRKEQTRASTPDKSQREKRPARESNAKGPRRSPDGQKRLYEESKQKEMHDPASSAGNLQTKGMHDDSDSDSELNDYRAYISRPEAQKPEPEPVPEPKVEPPVVEPTLSIAQKVALANNFSLQSGSLDAEAFPTLGGTKPAMPVVEDFPTLGNTRPKSQPQAQSKVNPVRPASKKVEHFPALGGSGKDARTKPKSANSLWNKGAPAISNKPVTNTQSVVKPKPAPGGMVKLGNTSSVGGKGNKTKTNQSSSVTSNANPKQQQHQQRHENNDGDFSSLSGIGGALLREKVTGSATEALAKYAPAASAAQPVVSNVRLVTEKPDEKVQQVQPASKPSFSHKNFPDTTNSTDSSNDFPSLGGSNSKRNNTSATWGPSKQANTKVKTAPKTDKDPGILKMKTKQKQSKAVKEGRSQSPQLFKGSSDMSSAQEKKDPASSKVKTEIKSNPDKDGSQDFGDFQTVENKSKAKQNEEYIKEDPVKAFLKHMQQEQQQFDEDTFSDDVEIESKKSKRKKKRKAAKEFAAKEQTKPVSLPAQTPTESTSNKENLPNSGFKSSALNENDSEIQNQSSVYKPKVELISEKPVVDTFPSFHNRLSTASSQALDLNDFPSLGGLNANKSKAPPPGFKGNQTKPSAKRASNSGPPPGLSQPPGFRQDISLGGIANGVLLTKAADVPSVASYSKPHNFDARNRQLITDIQRLIDGDKFAEFKHYSVELRRNAIDALSYFKECSNVFGKKNFESIFTELLVLLPDIQKQQELLQAHHDELKKSPKSRVGQQSSETFVTCPVCQQVLLPLDTNAHIDMHTDSLDFPTLGNAGCSINHS